VAAAAPADLDRDGDTDLAVNESGRVSILLNSGKGSFQAGASINVGHFSVDSSRPIWMATGPRTSRAGLRKHRTVARVEPGGWLLLGLRRSHSSGPGTRLTPCRGSGWRRGHRDRCHRLPFGRVAHPLEPWRAATRDIEHLHCREGDRAIHAGDLNGDGLVDLAAVELLGPDIVVLKNQGGGAFEETYIDSGVDCYGDPGWDGWRLILADTDSDGDIDIWTHTVGILASLQSEGTGTFHPVPGFATPSYRDLAVADLDGDSFLDIAQPLEAGGITIFWNDPRPLSQDADHDGLPDECAGRSFRRADANGDGFLNIADPVWVLRRLFLDDATIPCADAADVDDSESLDVTDAVYSLRFQFMDGPAPMPLSPAAEAIQQATLSTVNPTALARSRRPRDLPVGGNLAARATKVQ